MEKLKALIVYCIKEEDIDIKNIADFKKIVKTQITYNEIEEKERDSDD